MACKEAVTISTATLLFLSLSRAALPPVTSSPCDRLLHPPNLAVAAEAAFI